jgi:hypothetical protein
VSAQDIAGSPYGLGRRIWPVLVGPVVWSTHLLVGYFGGALLCRSHHEGAGWFGRLTAGHPFIIVVTVLAAIILLGAIVMSVLRRRRAPDGHDHLDIVGSAPRTEAFIDAVAIGVNAFSLVAVLVEGFWAAGMPC